MAEQDNHNVVISAQSTGGSAPLVDVALNSSTTEIAHVGNKTSTNNDNTDLTSSANIVHTTPLANIPSSLSELTKPNAGAEPSAGNAVFEGTKPAIEAQEVDDENTPDVSADHSIASDNETGKPDAVKDGGQHNRTNSVKKPATFSRVAVTKNFLAKSASTTPTVPKLGEKSAPVAMAAPVALKPRLVAKSASSLSNTLRARNGADSSPGPEAGTVWNKNRPAPSMPAKQFTDEELKQQYGIHLATRLQTDENGKGSKWADIDDDEDDWAPEAVVWMDGTKSTLTPAEISAAPTPVKSTASPPKPADAPKPSLTAMKKLGDSSSTIKTILKPGAAVQAKQQSGQNGGATSTEKPALKAKSPAPAPSKSPWAPLPPVDKVSPVNPPVQVQSQYQPAFVSQDVRVTQGLAPAGAPAREIAADTFDRSWRDGEGERRELFNSASGKYEPAPEGRRNSIKPDAYGRKPAVLPRVSQDSRVNSEAAFGHRRGSSVSHTSGPSARRMSYSRGSDSVVSDQPSSAAGQDSRPTPIGHTNPWSSQLPPVPAALPDGEDPVKVQERIMREKREAARQRRQEEEAREEAAKQERLKAKLNALAGAGLSRKQRQAAADTPAADALETESQKADAAPVNKESETTADSGDAALVPSAVLETSPHAQPREHLSPSTASRATFQSQNSGSYRSGTQQTSAFSSPGDRDRKLQPFGRSQAVNHDSFSPWPATSSSSNVWGVAGIGNGTFEASSMFAPMPQQISSLPPPPGMGRPGTSSRVSPQALGQGPQSSMQEAQLIDQSRAPGGAVGQTRPNGVAPQALGRQQHVPGPIGPPSRSQHQGSTQRDSVSAWQAAAQRIPNQYHLDAEVAEALKLSDSALGEPRVNNVFKETFRQTTGLQGRLGGSRIYEKPEYTIHDAQGSRVLSSAPNPIPPNAQTQPAGPEAQSTGEIWRQSGESAVRLPDGSLNPAHGGKAQQQPPIAPPSVSAIPAHVVRQAHFNTAPLAPAPAVSNATPPPPETSSHPVYADVTRRPHVRLPPPSPIVKLPPAAAHAGTPVMVPQRHMQNWGLPGHGQPIVKDREWQARFNGLLGRTSIQTETPPSPPRTPPKGYAPVIAVASSSRTTDEAHLFGDPTVALPRSQRSVDPTPFKVDDSSTVTSKEMVQQMFNDELGFGSRPKVRIPRTYKPVHEPLQSSAKLEPASVVSQTKPEIPLFHLFYKRPGGIFVKLPGSDRNHFMLEAHKSRVFSGKGGPRNKGATPAPKKEFRSTSGPVKTLKAQKAGVVGSDDAAAAAVSSARKRGHKKSLPAIAATPVVAAKSA